MCEIQRISRILGLLLLYCCFACTSHRALNSLNKHGRRSGHWITYYDESKTKKAFKGWYRDGKLKGKAYYYEPSGRLEHVENYQRRQMTISFYYPNGGKESEGYAKIDTLPDGVHYSFYGIRKCYDQQGVHVKNEKFIRGQRLGNEFLIEPGTRVDSLNKLLRSIHQGFLDRSSQITSTINLGPEKSAFEMNVRSIININPPDPSIREPLRKLLLEQDTSSYGAIDLFLATYGYPDFRFDAGAASLLVWMLDYTTIEVKESYLPLLKRAANKGYVDWSALSFYIDKLQISKREKQVYNTQHYILDNYKVVFFPCMDSTNIHKRRALVHLE